MTLSTFVLITQGSTDLYQKSGVKPTVLYKNSHKYKELMLSLNVVDSCEQMNNSKLLVPVHIST